MIPALAPGARWCSSRSELPAAPGPRHWRTRETSRPAQLKHLNLAFARKVGDGGMPALAKLTSLELVIFSGTAITDAGLRHLRAARALKTVRITPQQKITAGGIAELRRSLPGCEIGP